MPELPEVEVVMQLIRPHLMDNNFTTIESFVEKLRYPVDVHQSPDLLDSSITDVRRYGRYIVVELENLSGFIIHLGMTGQIRVVNSSEPPVRHDHVVLTLSSGMALHFNCVRKFGYITTFKLDEPGSLPDDLPELGPEPLTEMFSAEYLLFVCQKKRVAIKSLIMDNAVVVGVGNIYSAESLFDAGIHPKSPANTLLKDQVETLTVSIKKILASSITRGLEFNSEIKLPSGTEWKYPVQFSVYGHNGEPCAKCSSVIEKVTIGGRASFYCPSCQVI